MQKKENNGNGRGGNQIPDADSRLRPARRTECCREGRRRRRQQPSHRRPSRLVACRVQRKRSNSVCCANNPSIVRGVPMRPSHARSPSLSPPSSSPPSAGTTAAFSLHTDPVPSSAPATSAPVYRCSHADLIAIQHQLASDRPPQRVALASESQILSSIGNRHPPRQLGVHLLLSPVYTHGNSRNNTGASPSPTHTHTIPIDGYSARSCTTVLVAHTTSTPATHCSHNDTHHSESYNPIRVHSAALPSRSSRLLIFFILLVQESRGSTQHGLALFRRASQPAIPVSSRASP